MTLRLQNNEHSHVGDNPQTGASLRAPVEGSAYDNFVATEKSYLPQTICSESGTRQTLLDRWTRLTSQISTHQPKREASFALRFSASASATSAATTARAPRRDSSAALHRSRRARGFLSFFSRPCAVVSCGGCISCPNQASGAVGGQNELGKKTSLSLFSVSVWSLRPEELSRATGLLLASASRAASAPNATPTLSSQANRSRMRMLSTRSTANCLKLPCDVRAGAPAEINVRSFPSPMQGGRTWDQRRGLTNGDSLVLQPALTGRGPCDSGAINSSSGGGLGIHQPRSNGQGRARERAKCPAAARSIDGRA